MHKNYTSRISTRVLLACAVTAMSCVAALAAQPPRADSIHGPVPEVNIQGITGGASISLPTGKKSDAESKIQSSDKPVVMLGTSAECRDCAAVEQVVAKLSREYPGVSFVLVDGAEFGVAAERLPAVATTVPKYSTKSISRRFNVAPDAGLEAYLRARIDAVVKIAALDSESKSLNEMIQTKLEQFKTLYQNPTEQDRLRRAALDGEIAELLQRQVKIGEQLQDAVQAETRESTLNQ